MPLSDAQKAALNRLQSFYEGDNPYNSVSNPGGFRQGGHLYNFVPALKDLAIVIVGAAALAADVVSASANSPKALRVDSALNFTAAEKKQGKINLGAGGLIGGTGQAATLTAANMNGMYFILNGNFTIKMPAVSTLVSGDYIEITNISGGAATIALSDSDTSPLFYRGPGITGNSVVITPGGSLTVAYDGTNYLCFSRSLAPERSIDADNLQGFTSGQRSTMTRSLKLAASSYTYAQSNLTLSVSDIGTVFYIDAARTITLPLLSDCANGDTIEFFVNAGTLTLAQPAGNPNPISTPGATGATVALTAGAYMVKKQDQIWRVYMPPVPANNAVLRTGDTMTGTLKVDNGTLQIGKNGTSGVTGANLWQVLHSTDGNLYVQKADGSNPFVFGANGALSIPQFGDLNNRIEARAAAFAGNKVQDIRWVYAGDLGNEWSVNGGFQTPYSGAAIVDRATGSGNSGASTYYVHTFRWRYLQYYTPNAGGYVTTGFAS